MSDFLLFTISVELAFIIGHLWAIRDKVAPR